MTENAINWFDIPTKDINRAVKFYSTILDKELSLAPSENGIQMAMFPVEDGALSGALVQVPGFEPAATGTRVYLNGGENLTTVLDRVEAAGGKIVEPKSSLGEHGFMAFFTDTEGNLVGLHSMQ